MSDKELAAAMAADAVPERSRKPGKGREAGFALEGFVTIGAYLAGACRVLMHSNF